MFTSRQRIVTTFAVVLVAGGCLPVLAQAQVNPASPQPPITRQPKQPRIPPQPSLTLPGRTGFTPQVPRANRFVPDRFFPNPNSPYGAFPRADGLITPFVTTPGSYPADPSASYFPGYFPDYPYPYYYNPWSGIADIVREQGSFMMNQEMARVIREKSYQEFLKSRKMAVEFERWFKETEPTYTDLQVKNLAERLRRIQQFAMPGEISSGRALNVLFSDLKKQNLKAAKIEEPPFLSEEVLRQLNVTVEGTGGNLGLLRSNGSLSWPVALTDVADDKTRRDIEINAQDLVEQIRSTGKADGNKLKDLDAQVQKMRKELEAKALKMPFRRYLQADAFLENLRGAVDALENKNAAVKYFNYLQWIKGGKPVDELVRYMASEGLSFGNSTEGDEAAYEAAYAAMASYDIAFNTKLASTNGKKKKSPPPDQD